MDQVPAQQEVKPQISMVRSLPTTPFIILIILLLIPYVFLGLILGGVLPERYLQFVKLQKVSPAYAPKTQVVTEADLPISLSILKNPAVYEWRGSVEGTLMAKDQTSMTISSSKGITFTISVDPSPVGTRFYNAKGVLKTPVALLSLEEIPIGSKLVGDFWVLPGEKNKMVGNAFKVSEASGNR